MQVLSKEKASSISPFLSSKWESPQYSVQNFCFASSSSISASETLTSPCWTFCSLRLAFLSWPTIFDCFLFFSTVSLAKALALALALALAAAAWLLAALLEEALGAIIPTIPKLISKESRNMVVAPLGHKLTWCFIDTP